jgi:excisionase family DNA binding protein
MTAMLTVKDVAGRLNCSESFVYELLASGELKHFRLGKGQGGKRVSEEQLQEYLLTREHGGEGRPQPAPPAGEKTPSASGFTILDGERLKEAWKDR